MDPLNVLAGIDASDVARPALVSDAVTLSFGELARAASAVALRLEARGIGLGSRVAFVAAPSIEVVLLIHALAALGATLVPIHPRLSPVEARVAIEVAGAAHVLGPSDLEELAKSAANAGRDERRAAVPDDVPFAIVSTSGTTGRPKGAVLSRRAIAASAAASAGNFGWEADDRWLCCMPLAHVGGLSIITRCLIARRAVVLVPRFDAALVLEAIRRHAITLLSVVPTMLHALLEADGDGTLRAPRVVLLGGAAAPPALLDRCAEKGVRALTTYGLTEACSQVTAQAPRDPSLRLAGSGAALAGFDLRIADEHGAALPPHRVGRILVRGPSLFDGYLATDGVTIDAARAADPALAGSGFFDTGDLGELDLRGDLHVHVRRTDLIVTGGENVYPAEVEQAIEACPGVRRSMVFGVPDERWGHVVAAVVEASPGLTLSKEALSDFLSSRLATHKKPRKWAFVNQLPLTPSGKVDRKDALSRHGHLLLSDPQKIP